MGSAVLRHADLRVDTPLSTLRANDPQQYLAIFALDNALYRDLRHDFTLASCQQITNELDRSHHRDFPILNPRTIP